MRACQTVDIPGKQVHLTYAEDQISIDRVKELLEEEGFPVAGVSHSY